MGLAVAAVAEIRDWLTGNPARYMERLPEDLGPPETRPGSGRTR